MEIKTVEFQKKWAFLAEKEIYIACSGGVDSIVLTHLISSFCKNITLLHVNYNLRENDSLQDEQFVQELASNLNLKIEVKSVDTSKLLSQNGGNLQEVARNIRFDWFNEKITDENSILLLAHHEDDQIETFYQHLARKSGILGLACMLEQYKNFIRPLLTFSKEEIYSFARKNKISWREDLSNQTNKYSRNKLRNEILPFLYSQNPELKKSVLHLIQVFQENQLLLEESVEEIIQKIETEGVLKINSYQDLSFEQKLIVFKSFHFSAQQLPEIESLINSQKGKSILNETYKITKESDYFAISKKKNSFKIPEIEIKQVEYLPEIFSKNEIYLDASKIIGKLYLRTWQIGDRISPIGLNGSKLISDVITEAKIPNAKRENVLVLVDEINIHWCVSLKISKIAAASQNSTEILKINLASM